MSELEPCGVHVKGDPNCCATTPATRSPAPDPGAGLAELRTLSDAATTGPWQTGRIRKGWTVDGLFITRTILADMTALNDEANATFIVAAVNYVRSLLAPSAEPPETAE